MPTPQQNTDRDVRDAFLAGAAVVLDALRTDVVAAHWGAPSVLEDQTVGVLAGHLGRTGVVVVADYLGQGAEPGDVAFDSAASYYAILSDRFSPDDHVAVRQRSRSFSESGPAATAALVEDALHRLEDELPGTDLDDTFGVYGGSRMRVGEYLLTRVVEQAVHLDDLRRSVPGASFEPPALCVDIAVAVGVEVGIARRGAIPMLRSLYHDPAAALPVL